MTRRNPVAKASSPRSKPLERLKDEVYRQMYRLEASRPGAELSLAIVLLRAWITTASETEISELREWLAKICPICLLMIEAAEKVSDTERQCAQ